MFNYPPFTRIIKLTIKDRDHQIASEAVGVLYNKLTSQLGQPMVLNPITPPVGKIRDRFLRELYLKIGRKKDIKKVKDIILENITDIVTQKAFKTVSIIIDVDPN